MKVVLKSLTALCVAAALAVPFAQDGSIGWSHGQAKASGNQQVKQVELRNRADQNSFPAVYASLSTKTRKVPDFADIYDVNERKREFFAYLLPAIEETNARIYEQRELLLSLADKYLEGESLTRQEIKWLERLSDYYRVEEAELEGMLSALVSRVDIVPATVVLIQAANESGWGTSRFAREGLNFFGQWCWTPGCGIVPGARPEGQVYEVRRFDSMEASVMAFVRNLNTHFAYEDLRVMRLEEREMDDTVSSATITAGLMSYSERGQDYIDELNQMIRINRPIIEEIQTADIGS